VGVVLPKPIQFGKYTLFERIGRGGMADVFKGRVQGPAGFERIFVVKRILPHLSDDPAFNKMFVGEAKMSARLNHPNIVQVFELGSVESEYFISMEYVRGRDLAETMRTLWARVGPPRPELVSYVGREMCRALDYAHHLTDEKGKQLGMIHRDVSPSNVMLSFEGAVKLLDFGIAKALGGDGGEEGTQKGTLKGKFAYMAPEQTRGADVDHRIDVFATGIVLHEVLTGRRLFKGENDLQTVEKVRQCEVPPPSLQNPLCPPELDAIVMQALARDPDHRFQHASEMAEALDDIVHVTRFQPTHLAGLLRDLFPGEAPTDGRSTATGSVRITQSIPTSSSRPYALQARSPTVPAVPLTMSGTVSAPASVPSRLADSFKHVPLYKRTGVIIGLFSVLLVAGVWGAVVVVTRDDKPTVIMTTAGGVRDGEHTVRVDSMPDGARVLLKSNGKVLGTTPCMVTVDWKAAEPTRLVLRKDGYEDVEKEVQPPLAIFASLKPEIRLPSQRKQRRTGENTRVDEPEEAEPEEDAPSDRRQRR